MQQQHLARKMNICVYNNNIWQVTRNNNQQLQLAVLAPGDFSTCPLRLQLHAKHRSCRSIFGIKSLQMATGMGGWMDRPAR